MVVTLCKLEGQSPGLQIIMEPNATDLDYKDLKQLVMALAKHDLMSWLLTVLRLPIISCGSTSKSMTRGRGVSKTQIGRMYYETLVKHLSSSCVCHTHRCKW